MNEEDKKYLRLEKKTRPSFEVFKKLVEILKQVQGKTDRLLNASLPKTPKVI